MSSDPTTTTPVSDWKADAGSLGELTTLPSGKTARIKAAGMDAFLKAGSIPNSLLDIVTSQLEKAKKGEEVKEEEFDLDELMKDPTKLADIIQLVDVVTLSVFVEPRVYPLPPEPGPEEDPSDPKFQRRGDILYVDELDYNDKFFAFSVAVGGTKNLARFHDELASSVARVQPRKAVSKSKPKPTRRTGARKS